MRVSQRRAGADIRLLMSARFAAAKLVYASAIAPKSFATRNRRLQEAKFAPAIRALARGEGIARNTKIGGTIRECI